MGNVLTKSDGFSPGKLYTIKDSLLEFFSVLEPCDENPDGRRETVLITAFGYPLDTVLMYVNQEEKTLGPFLDPDGKFVMIATWNDMSVESLVPVSEESSVNI